MKKFYLFSLAVLSFCSISFSQTGIQGFSSEFQKAVLQQTRTNEGIPGPKYWQNHAGYNISVEVIPETGLLSGSETITYFNQSPDTLKRIVFRLYQNIYKKGNSRQFAIGTEDLSDGVEISNLKIDGLDYDVNSKKVSNTATNMVIRLDKPVLPGGSANISLNWKFNFPKKRMIRFGLYNPGHLLAGYWYPQVAVYDDIDGWDMIDYAGMVEFYNDFNNFNVKIIMPGSFVVWATGELQNPDKVLKKEIAGRYEKSKTSEEVVNIITQADYQEGQVTKQGEKHTWEFAATGVPDFTFAASDHANWDATSLVVDKLTGRRVQVSAVYPDSAVHYEKVAALTRDAIAFMSFEWPGYPFPYPQATVFANGRKTGGMEYPMMANDGAPDDLADLTGLTYHEVFHNYMPFAMGTNERKWAFMDEGWARFFPSFFLQKQVPEDKYFQRSIKAYEEFAGKQNELPPIIPTYIFNDYQTQRMAAYTRPAVAFHLLKITLGDDVFKKSLHLYMSRWMGKHPQPADFFQTFSEAAGEDLSWFWQPWFYQFGYPDLSIKEVTSDGVLVIERKGSFPVPVEVTITSENGKNWLISENARVWKDGKKLLNIPLENFKTITSIELGNNLIPDVNRKDNSWFSKNVER